MCPSGLTWSTVCTITHRRMVKLSKSTKSLRICWGPVFCNISEVGTRVFPGTSSRTIIIIKRAWRWPHLRFYRDDDVVPHIIGLRLGRKWYLNLTSSQRLKRSFIISMITWKPWSHAKRLMQTRGIDPWSLKWEIMYTWGSHQWRAWRDLGWKGSWCLATSDHSPSLRNVELWLTSLTYHHPWVHDIFHVLQMKKCLKKCLKWHRSRLTCHTQSTQSKSWIRRIVSQGVKQSSSSRYNGATTLKKKQLGKVRTFFVLTTWTSCCYSEECATVRCSC
jgi:hypothetical protein